MFGLMRLLLVRIRRGADGESLLALLLMGLVILGCGRRGSLLFRLLLGDLVRDYVYRVGLRRFGSLLVIWWRCNPSLLDRRNSGSIRRLIVRDVLSCSGHKLVLMPCLVDMHP